MSGRLTCDECGRGGARKIGRTTLCSRCIARRNKYAADQRDEAKAWKPRLADKR